MTTGMTDLKSLERTAFRKFYDDGILDMYLGAMLIVMGLSALIADRVASEGMSMLIMLGLALIVTIPLLIVRRRLLRARLGTFVPGPARKRRIQGTRLVLLASVAVGVVMFGVGTAIGDSSVDTFAALLPVIWFFNSAIVFGAGAYFLDVPRFYLIGVIYGMAMPLLIWPDLLWDFRVAPWIAFGLPGAVVLAIGVDRLIRFLRDYPATEPSDVAI